MRIVAASLMLVAFVAMVGALLFPWHQVPGPVEADDGEHLWGSSDYDDSTWAWQEGANPIRLPIFGLAVAGVVLTALAWSFALGDLRGATLAFTWLGLAAWGTAGALLVTHILEDRVLEPALGLFLGGGAALLLFLTGFLAAGVGQSRRAPRGSAQPAQG